MIFPKKLPAGGTVGLVAPCSPIPEERLARCVETITGMGFRVRLSDNICSVHGGYMAGDGRERGEWINRMFADDSVDAIFCIRGGDGAGRTIRFIAPEIVRANPKIFVGYSDVTLLHLMFNQQCGLVTFHGPMVSSNMADAFDDDTREAFFRCINGDGDYVFRNPPEEELKVMFPGRAEGMVIGGNLSLLSAAMGTPWEPDTRGRILFIEEVHENVTKIEKWICHLKNGGKFRDCAGVLLGQFTDITNRYMPSFSEYDCIRELLADEGCPVMYNLQSGHGEKMITVPFGTVCTMDTGTRSVIFRGR